MGQPKKAPPSDRRALSKAATGIQGFDEITFGGLPRGRTTLICGGAGCGKTMFGVEFLSRGAMQYNEPGVLVSFEEPIANLTKDAASLGFDLAQLAAKKKLFLDHVRIERSEIEETGEFDLDGLFRRIAYSVQKVRAKRIVLDTIEALFAELPNPGILRAEIRRLFGWLTENGLTAVVTAERHRPDMLTRHGLEEFVSDCVILVDHRVVDDVSTRRLRVAKYRGSKHGTNEYPFLMDDNGISVLPISSLGLNHAVSNERISSGVARLDAMLGGQGFYRGSSILVSGTTGTGKSSIAASFAEAACRRGERCLYFAFEESPQQIIRNMRSIGVNLESMHRKGLLKFHAARPTNGGIEQHLALIHKWISDFDPSAVVVDPITNLVNVGSKGEVQSMLTRLVDFLKTRQITAMFNSLTLGGGPVEATDSSVSSLMDTWLLLESVRLGGERNRTIAVLKSRGMEHSNQVREFLLTSKGIHLRDVYLGSEGVLTGSARLWHEARADAADLARLQESEDQRRELERSRKVFEARSAGLRAEFEAEQEKLQRGISHSELALKKQSGDRSLMRESRKADPASGKPKGRGRDVRGIS